MCAPSLTAGRPTSRISANSIFPPTPPLGTFRLLSCQSSKQECTEHDKKNVRKPNEQLRVHFRVSAQRVADDDEEEITDGHDQAHGETNRSLAAVRGDAKRYADNRERSASRTEINKRFSFPFACIAFAIIGVPLGVTAHRRETSIGFAMGLIVAVSYFLFVIIGDTLRGNPRVHPELLVWFPNVLFIVLGAFLFRRLARQ